MYKVGHKIKLAICFLDNIDITDIKPSAIHMQNLYNQIKTKQDFQVSSLVHFFYQPDKNYKMINKRVPHYEN